MQEISFGEWLSRQRKLQGWTQKQLADQLNCATITLRKMEADQRRPSLQTVERLAQCFNIPHKERGEFTRFARGNGQMVLAGRSAALPWNVSESPSFSTIPIPLTSLIGRKQDLSALKDDLQDANIRLVTLAGPPGIGKTRLSYEVLRELAPNFPDGVYFIPLATVDLPGLLPATILKSLEFTSHRGGSPVERLIQNIHNRSLFLVLDNVEHLIEEVATLVYDLLLACPYIKILVTSREALHLPGELVYQVPALQLPAEAQLPTLDVETAMQSPALRLFTERAMAANPGFSINIDNVKDIASICSQLDGLPLAIELLAARTSIMTPQNLFRHLNSHVVLHTPGGRSQSVHQKTLYHAIHWSYDLLTIDEKRVFTYLSVFNGGFSLESAEKAFRGSLRMETVDDIIASLLEKSLIQSITGAMEMPRFHMLSTIQQFATEKLQELGEETSAHELHLGYFHRFSKEMSEKISRPGQPLWIGELEIEQANLFAALSWSILFQKTSSCLSLLKTLSELWLVRGNYSEIDCWLGEVQSLPDLDEHASEYTELTALISKAKWILGENGQLQAVMAPASAEPLAKGIPDGNMTAENVSHPDFVTGKAQYLI